MTEEQLNYFLKLFAQGERLRLYHNLNVVCNWILSITLILCIIYSVFNGILLGIILINFGWGQKIRSDVKKLRILTEEYTDKIKSDLGIDS